jgi:lysophospholipase L1-like esterase
MKTIGLFALLALIALPPSGWSAETNHNYTRWEKEIAAYERADLTNAPPTNAILFVGSSTIRLWKTLAQDFPEHRVINRGFGGSQIVDSTHFAARIIFPYAPKMIFLRAGGNDIAAGKTAEEVFGDFKEFVATVHARLPETEIVFIGLAPSVARWKQAEAEKTLNRLVAGFVNGKPSLRFVETYDTTLGADGKPRAELFIKDMLHFNAEGYKLLTERVRTVMPKP